MVAPSRQRVAQQRLQHGDGSVVERSEGLVEQQDFGIVQEGAGDREALPHAAGKLPRHAVLNARRDPPARALRWPPSPDSATPMQLAEQDQILERREIVVNADAVAQIADARAPFRRARMAESDLALRGFGKIGEDAQQGGLARAVAAQQREARALRNFEIRAAQGGIIAEVLPDAISRDRVHLGFSSVVTRCPRRSAADSPLR